jgi:hypothetical protein
MLASIANNSAPPNRIERLAKELVDARAGGIYKVGLWEIVDGGWLFHDWADYQPELPKLSRSEAASVAGKRSAQVRAEKHGTSQPVRVERPPNDSRTFESNETESFDGRSTNVVRAVVRRTTVERPEPLDLDLDLRSNLTQISSQRPESSSQARPAGSGVGENESKKPESSPVVRRRVRLSDLEQDFPALCRALEINPNDASFHPVQSRPEVVELHQAWCAATGLEPRRLGSFQRDGGVRAICALYALDYSRDDLIALVQCAGKDKWIMGLEDGPNGRPKDIAVLSPAKAGALLDLAKVAQRKAERAKSKLDAERERERATREEERSRANAPRPAPVDISRLFASVPSTGFTAPSKRGSVTAPTVQRSLTAEEIDRALGLDGQVANA